MRLSKNGTFKQISFPNNVFKNQQILFIVPDLLITSLSTCQTDERKYVWPINLLA